MDELNYPTKTFYFLSENLYHDNVLDLGKMDILYKSDLN